jgi:hypothetical protein
LSGTKTSIFVLKKITQIIILQCKITKVSSHCNLYLFSAFTCLLLHGNLVFPESFPECTARNASFPRILLLKNAINKKDSTDGMVQK